MASVTFDSEDRIVEINPLERARKLMAEAKELVSIELREELTNYKAKKAHALINTAHFLSTAIINIEKLLKGGKE